jgi:hypothetical protein
MFDRNLHIVARPCGREKGQITELSQRSGRTHIAQKPAKQAPSPVVGGTSR